MGVPPSSASNIQQAAALPYHHSDTEKLAHLSA